MLYYIHNSLVNPQGLLSITILHVHDQTFNYKVLIIINALGVNKEYQIFGSHSNTTSYPSSCLNLQARYDNITDRYANYKVRIKLSSTLQHRILKLKYLHEGGEEPTSLPDTIHAHRQAVISNK